MNPPRFLLCRYFVVCSQLRIACLLLFSAFTALATQPDDGNNSYAWRTFVGPRGVQPLPALVQDSDFEASLAMAARSDGSIYFIDVLATRRLIRIAPFGLATEIASLNPYSIKAITVAPDGTAYGVTTGYSIIQVTPAGTVSVIAGGGFGDAVDGVGTEARFGSPKGIAVASDGSLYVSDLSAIRKVVPPLWAVTTVAGLPYSNGAANGTGALARFVSPAGLAMGPDGFLYIADQGNHMIRKMSPAFAVTTVAGADTPNSPGSVDGVGTSARFRQPSHLVVDATGTIFVTDSKNYTIRRISPSQEVTTHAGTVGSAGIVDAVGTAAKFSNPAALAFDAGGDLLVVDDTRIRRIAPDRTVSTYIWGDKRIVIGTFAADDSFAGPNGAEVGADGSLFVADQFNHRIRKVSPEGVVTTLAGSQNQGSTDGLGAAARFKLPQGVGVAAGGLVLVADRDNHRIRSITADGLTATVAGGIKGWQDDVGTQARFDSPTGITADAAGYYYVADQANSAVRRISPDATVETWAGFPGVPGTADGTGLNARLRAPAGIAASPDGTLYLADTGNNAIRKVSPSQVVTTLAGLPEYGSADGVGSAARFWGPRGVAVDVAGNVFVADTINSTIRRITPAGVVTTIGGRPLVGGRVNGVGATALFSETADVAVGAGGVLYVVDRSNSRIAVGEPQITQAQWRQSFFGTTENSGPAADSSDPDQDGLTNLVEFAFGQNPLSGTQTPPLPQLSVVNGFGLMAFTSSLAKGVSYTAETTPSLQADTWSPVPNQGTAGNFVFAVPLTEQGRVFMRIKVTPE